MKAFLGLGSNIGDRRRWLRLAVSKFPTVVAVSSVYETEPVGGPDQGAYLNMVIAIETDLSAQDLLSFCQQIEQEAGRIREILHGPRTLDVDILLYGDESIDTPDLVVPHPRMGERNFVLVPLREIAPDLNLECSDVPFGDVVKLGDL